MQRISSGVKYIDDNTEGGFPAWSNILIKGRDGSGKSIFGLQFLNEGIKHGENGLYVCIEETSGSFKAQAKNFGWDFEKYEAEGKVKFIDIPPDMNNFPIFDVIEKAVHDIGAKRLVFDSVSEAYDLCTNFRMSLRKFEPEDKVHRLSDLDAVARPVDIAGMKDQFLHILLKKINSLQVCALFVSYEDHNSKVKVSHACDGIVSFDHQDTVETQFNANDLIKRTLQVTKMRKTKLKLMSPKEFEFTNDGIATR